NPVPFVNSTGIIKGYMFPPADKAILAKLYVSTSIMFLFSQSIFLKRVPVSLTRFFYISPQYALFPYSSYQPWNINKNVWNSFNIIPTKQITIINALINK